MNILTPSSKQLILIPASGIEARNRATGRALRPALAVHLHADTAVGDARLAGGVASAAGELARAVIGAAADAFAQEEAVVAWTAFCTGAVVGTLRCY